MDSTRNRTCVVTGSASGIGAATVLALAAEGYDTVGLDIQVEAAERVALQAALESPGTRHNSWLCDITDEQAVVAAFQRAAQTLGRIDALVTSAGVVDTTPFFDIRVEDFRRVHEVNVIGTWLCMREAARYMQAGAAICAVASIAGLRGGGLSGTAAYAASKGGVIALAKNAARVLAERGIRVNTVSPGATDTPMIERPLSDPAHRRRIEGLAALGRIGTAAEIAAGIVWLLSPAAAFTHGAHLVIDGGVVL